MHKLYRAILTSIYIIVMIVAVVVFTDKLDVTISIYFSLPEPEPRLIVVMLEGL